MSGALAKQMMRRGRTSRERSMGRALARGARGLPPGLRLAVEYADRIAKDFGAAPAGATTGSQVYTPVADSGGKKRVARKTRLAIPFTHDE